MPLPARSYVSRAWRAGLFEDRVVFCTGGNGTICSVQVRAMVYLGANACIVGRNVQKTESVAKDISTARPGSKVLGIGNVDVRNISDLKKAIEQCVMALGGIDFVIAGAAGNFLALFSQLSPNAFKSVMEIDVLGSYNVAKLALPHLMASVKKRQSGITGTNTCGRIIFISATMHYTGYPLQTHVAVAKAGVDALSANVAIEYGPLGVTSNVISPGPIGGTEGMRKLAKADGAGRKEGWKVPLQRYGDVKDIADATVYLFSDAANYVNGVVLVVDGGAWRTLATGPDSGEQYPEVVTKVHNDSKL